MKIDPKLVLVTGGAGYIGSHTIVQLVKAGFQPVIFDNWCNSSRAVLSRLEQLTGSSILAIDGDLRSLEDVRSAFKQHAFGSVIHFAGLKAVGESHQMPIEYYVNNVGGSLNLVQAMREAGCKSLVFSSSATVYGNPDSVPIKEGAPLRATNPYGQTKLMVEEILRDVAASDGEWSIALMRYFNPVGAHASGLIGEDPHGIPNNLVPFIAQVAVGRLAQLNVYGDDYPTPDGTGVRDYIHVEDLGAAHVSALNVLPQQQGCHVYNVGTGQGHSVLEVIRAFEATSDKAVPYQVVARRAGDIAECYADPQFAESALNWRAKHGLEKMLADHWNWQKSNPNGYESD